MRLQVTLTLLLLSTGSAFRDVSGRPASLWAQSASHAGQVPHDGPPNDQTAEAAAIEMFLIWLNDTCHLSAEQVLRVQQVLQLSVSRDTSDGIRASQPERHAASKPSLWFNGSASVRPFLQPPVLRDIIAELTMPQKILLKHAFADRRFRLTLPVRSTNDSDMGFQGSLRSAAELLEAAVQQKIDLDVVVPLPAAQSSLNEAKVDPLEDTIRNYLSECRVAMEQRTRALTDDITSRWNLNESQRQSLELGARGSLLACFARWREQNTDEFRRVREQIAGLQRHYQDSPKRRQLHIRCRVTSVREADIASQPILISQLDQLRPAELMPSEARTAELLMCVLEHELWLLPHQRRQLEPLVAMMVSPLDAADADRLLSDPSSMRFAEMIRQIHDDDLKDILNSSQQIIWKHLKQFARQSSKKP